MRVRDLVPFLLIYYPVFQERSWLFRDNSSFPTHWGAAVIFTEECTEIGATSF
jgi:hypothetical protein